MTQDYEFIACNRHGVMLAQGFWRHGPKGDVRRAIAKAYGTTYGKVSVAPVSKREDIFLTGETK